MVSLKYLFPRFKCSAPLAPCYNRLPRVNKGHLFIYLFIYLFIFTIKRIIYFIMDFQKRYNSFMKISSWSDLVAISSLWQNNGLCSKNDFFSLLSPNSDFEIVECSLGLLLLVYNFKKVTFHSEKGRILTSWKITIKGSGSHFKVKFAYQPKVTLGFVCGSLKFYIRSSTGRVSDQHVTLHAANLPNCNKSFIAQVRSRLTQNIWWSVTYK